jgi:hypothetical protein
VHRVLATCISRRLFVPYGRFKFRNAAPGALITTSSICYRQGKDTMTMSLDYKKYMTRMSGSEKGKARAPRENDACWVIGTGESEIAYRRRRRSRTWERSNQSQTRCWLSSTTVTGPHSRLAQNYCRARTGGPPSGHILSRLARTARLSVSNILHIYMRLSEWMRTT